MSGNPQPLSCCPGTCPKQEEEEDWGTICMWGTPAPEVGAEMALPEQMRQIRCPLLEAGVTLYIPGDLMESSCEEGE